MAKQKTMAVGFQRLIYKVAQMETTVRELKYCINGIKNELRQFEIDFNKEYISESAAKTAAEDWANKKYEDRYGGDEDDE